MQRRLSYLIVILALAAMAVACNKVKVIPQGDMVRLYKEMYMADQWIRDAGNRMRMADTSYVYRPILAKYGYTEDDFRASVDYYTDRPKEFVTIFEQVAADFKEAKKVIAEKEKLLHQKDSTIRAREAMPYHRADFTKVPEYDFWITRLNITLDTTLNVFRFEAIDIFKDSLAVDSLAVASDSLKVAIEPEVAKEKMVEHAVTNALPKRKTKNLIKEKEDLVQEALVEDEEIK